MAPANPDTDDAASRGVVAAGDEPSMSDAQHRLGLTDEEWDALRNGISDELTRLPTRLASVQRDANPEGLDERADKDQRFVRAVLDGIWARWVNKTNSRPISEEERKALWNLVQDVRLQEYSRRAPQTSRRQPKPPGAPQVQRRPVVPGSGRVDTEERQRTEAPVIAAQESSRPVTMHRWQDMMMRVRVLGRGCRDVVLVAGVDCVPRSIGVNDVNGDSFSFKTTMRQVRQQVPRMRILDAFFAYPDRRVVISIHDDERLQVAVCVTRNLGGWCVGLTVVAEEIDFDERPMKRKASEEVDAEGRKRPRLDDSDTDEVLE